jgi:mannose-6-phosphate isomerase-like protein (cupin superfamily)
MQGERMVGGCQRLHALSQEPALDIEQCHAPAFREETLCHGKPDAARSTRHQSDSLRRSGHKGSFVHDCRVVSSTEGRRLLFWQYQQDKGPNAMKVNDPEQIPIEQWRPGVETRMLVSARNGATQLCMFEQWVAPGNGAPTHAHPVEEVLTVREGQAEMWIGQERVIVTAGQSLTVPAGRQHGFRNCGTVTLHLHAVLASAVFEATPEGATEPVRRWNTSA